MSHESATLGGRDADELSLSARIRENPRPALLWTIGFLAVFVLELGAFLEGVFGLFLSIVQLLPTDLGTATIQGLHQAAGEIPRLLSRDVIPNRGHQLPAAEGGGWDGTFLGLSPKYAWLLRVGLIYAWSTLFLYMLWRGYRTYRTHYRIADWSPIDDQIDRFSRHTWGRFGLVVVVFFVIMAVFAAPMGTAPAEENIYSPYDHEIEYLDEETDTVETILIGDANIGSASEGASDNVGPWTYDDFDRFHPLGTLGSGKDLLTFLAHGAQISLFIGLASIAAAGFVAIALAMLTSYYKGLTDLIVVVTSDSIQAIPVFLILIMAMAVFREHWLTEIFNGALLLIALFALTNWTFIWRAIRGPSLQVAEEEWIDAAKSYGQAPRKTMQKHMLPYTLGYLLVYGSLRVGGIIVAIAGLSYLGLGINPPTPEWGRAIAAGETLVATPSWHIAFFPGIFITLLVTGLNAFGDGIRDAIDPQSEGGDANEAQAAGGGA